MSYSSEVLADSPLVYLKLDEASGTTAADSSGSSRDGTYSPGITVGATSLLTDGTGRAASFASDTSTGIAVTSASYMNVSALTVECLVNFSSSPDVGNGDGIVSRYGGGGFQWLVWRNTSGKLAFQINTTGTAFANVVGTTTPTLGTTYVVTATWDGSLAKLFVNGVQEGSSVSVTGSLATSSEDMRIAAYSGAAVTVPGMVIDEVSFTGSAISGARISARYTAATTVPTPTGTLAATLPTVTGSFAGSYVAPTPTGTLTATLPKMTASLSGAYAVTAGATGTFAATIPSLGSAFSGEYLGPYPTDTSNSRDGLDILLTATVTVPTPAAVTPSRAAVKYDKSVPYPPPTLVNGRPT